MDCWRLGEGETGALKLEISIASPWAFLIWIAALFLGALKPEGRAALPFCCEPETTTGAWLVCPVLEGGRSEWEEVRDMLAGPGAWKGGGLK